MDITTIIELLPDTVKKDIIDFHDVRMKTGASGIRVTLDRLLTDTEKKKMQNKRIVGLDCIASYRYAPEIKKSYFYVMEV